MTSPARTPRGLTLRWLTKHRRTTEQPAGSNTDNRVWGIKHAQLVVAGGASYLIGQPWCGVWACRAALVGGVKIRKPERWASVLFIEQDARAKTNGFRGWTTNPSRVLRADLVVLFGAGVHVETVRSMRWRHLGLVRTEGGNTSSGRAGSQANGGGSYPRWRRLSDVHGFALVNYPNS